MKQKQKHLIQSILSFVLTAALVFGMIPGVSMGMVARAATTKTVTYIDADGKPQSAEATVLTGAEEQDSEWWDMIPLGTAGATTYYIAEGTLTYSAGFLLQGDVVLILGDNAHLTINNTNNMYVTYGTYETDSNGGGDNLTITSQSLGSSMGRLTGTSDGGIMAKNIIILLDKIQCMI